MDLQQPPSGTFLPIGQADISAAVAFTGGTPLSVPFDRIQFNKGEALRAPNPAIPDVYLGVGPGLWLFQAQFSLSVAPATSVVAQLQCESDSQLLQSQVKWGSVDHGVISLNALQLNSYAALQVDNIFAALRLIITGTGTSGNVTSAQIFAFRMGQK